MNTIKHILLFAAIVYAVPSHAAFDNTVGILGAIGTLFNLMIALGVASALLFFFWGLAKFILASGNEAAIEMGKSRMIWGITALFFLVSVWAIVAFFQLEIFGGTSDDLLDNPEVRGIDDPSDIPNQFLDTTSA